MPLKLAPVLVLSLVLLLASIPPLHAAPANSATAAQPSGTIERRSFHATSLENNPLGDPAEQPVLVYLPPSYGTEPQRRYPVVYLLHGLGMKPADWEVEWPGHPPLSAAITQAINARDFAEMIVVYANGANGFLGSLYMNSSLAGRWEDAIVRDLVTWTDAHFRTLPQASSRGLAGLSMGGFGALRLGFLHPDIFGAVYALSPAFIGFAADFSAENPTMIAAPGARSYADLQRIAGSSRTRENYAGLIFICAAALSPAPEEKPLPVKFPFVVNDGRLVPNETVHAQWLANMPLTMIDAHLPAIRRLRGIGFDVGTSDHFRHIPITVRALDRVLTEHGVPHVFEEFAGDHTTHTQQRLIENALPFLAKKLLFSTEKN